MNITEKEASTIEINKYRDDLAARDIKIHRLEILVSELRHKVAIGEASLKIQDLLKQRDLLKTERVAIINPIKERLKLDGPFGFDPDTLEVITNEED